MDRRRLRSALEHARLRRELPPPDERRRIRQRAGLPLRALAAALGVAPRTICGWEREGRTPARVLREYVEILQRLKAEGAAKGAAVAGRAACAGDDASEEVMA